MALLGRESGVFPAPSRETWQLAGQGWVVGRGWEGVRERLEAKMRNETNFLVKSFDCNIGLGASEGA